MKTTVHEFFTNTRMDGAIFAHSWLYLWMVFGVTALRETIRLMREVDGVIDVNGGWPVK